MSKVYLYHEDCEEGSIFDASEMGEMIENGWVDTPTKLDLPDKKPELTVTEEQARKASPDQVIAMIKNLGFLVMTPEEFEAEVNKRAFSDSKPTEAQVTLDGELIEYQNVFDSEPTELTKEELVYLGNAKHKLGLRMNMKEATLIEKIAAAMVA